LHRASNSSPVASEPTVDVEGHRGLMLVVRPLLGGGEVTGAVERSSVEATDGFKAGSVPISPLQLCSYPACPHGQLKKLLPLGKYREPNAAVSMPLPASHYPHSTVLMSTHIIQ
jgi:hypothetical protein